MAKKNSIPPVKQPVTPQPVLHPAIGKILFPAWLSDFRIQALIVAALAFILYINTSSNEYALDDTMSIIQNEYVLEGFEGIPDIFTKDSYYSFFNRINAHQVSGGRYRPLAIATFAIEQQFFGAVPKSKIDSFLNHQNPVGVHDPNQKKFFHARHIVNVILFALSVVVLLYFLRWVVFKNDPVIAFLAAIIFTIHPIHTEVVANMKSRDEILSLLFICLTFIFAFKYREHKKKWMLGLALLSCALAFLSKEYAVILIVLLPLSFYLFNNDTLKSSIISSLPYILLSVLYVFIRSQILAGGLNDNLSTDLQNSPYLYASHIEKIATVISTDLNYLKLLVFPHPLSADYSYNSIPYVDFSNWMVWLSLAIHLALVRYFFYYLKRRNVLSFAIAFYFLNLLLVGNLLFDIGATMGERLIYHASVGFSIAVAYFLYLGMEKIKSPALGKTVLAGSVVLFIGLCGFKTIERNAQWKNDYTLFSHDINVVPNSILVNKNVAVTHINNSQFLDEKKQKEQLRMAIDELHKVIAMDSSDVESYMYIEHVYFILKVPDSMFMYLNKARAHWPGHTQLPGDYYNTGSLYFQNKQYPQALAAWQICLKLNPGFKQASDGVNYIVNMGLIANNNNH